jgi:hypothetical protein
MAKAASQARMSEFPSFTWKLAIRGPAFYVTRVPHRFREGAPVAAGKRGCPKPFSSFRPMGPKEFLFSEPSIPMMVAYELVLETVVEAEMLVMVFAVEMVMELMNPAKIMQNEKAREITAGEVERIWHPIVVAVIVPRRWIIGHDRRPLSGVIALGPRRLTVGFLFV